MDITIFWAQFIHALCFVLGALMKQHTECCLNCSTVTEGPSGAVSLGFHASGKLCSLVHWHQFPFCTWTIPGCWWWAWSIPRVTFGSLSGRSPLCLLRFSQTCDLQVSEDQEEQCECELRAFCFESQWSSAWRPQGAEVLPRPMTLSIC